MTPEQAIQLRIKTARELYYYYTVNGNEFNHVKYPKTVKNKLFKYYLKQIPQNND